MSGRGTGKKKIDLDGRTWIRYSISVWDDIRKTKEEASLRHPAMFPLQLVRRLASIYTFPGDLILDPFAGSGSTLLAAVDEGRRAVGMDISQEYVDICRSRLGDRPGKIVCGDARDLGQHVSPGSVDLCVTSPPYWNILSRKRSADGKQIRDYEQEVGNLGGVASYRGFLEQLRDVFSCVFTALRPGCRLAVVVMDIRRGPIFYPLHMDLSLELLSLGFELEDIIIWDRRSEYNNLRPLGYPYVFRVNKVHEYVMLFRRPPT